MNALRALALGAALAVPALLGAQKTATAVAPSDLARQNARDLDLLAHGEKLSGLPPADSVTAGARRIDAGITVQGSVVARGPVDVFGTVSGNVVSLAGDVTVHRGGIVRGDALSVGGHVVADSGRVDGEMRAMSALPTSSAVGAAVQEARTPVQRTLDAMRVVAGTFGILLIVAIGVLLFAGHNLDEVVGTLERQFAKSFWIGLLGQLLILPVLVVLAAALAVSIIGILLIPFAIVAYAIAAAGLVTLGFLAVARLVGGALRPMAGAAARSRALWALATGIAVFFVLWMVAAMLGWAPLAATVVRAAALAATWAAVTLGLGAALLSRAGTHRRIASGGRPVELAAWQTPTPITGVVAARRPTAVAREAR